MSKTTESMNLLLADIHVLYTKIQNYHWNVKGPYFFGMHDKTEEYYNHFATIYDELAERVLQLEGKPIVTLKQVLELSRLKEDGSTDFDAAYVAKNLLSDFDFLRKEFKSLAEVSEDDSTTVAFCDEQVAFLEKENWMLKSFLS